MAEVATKGAALLARFAEFYEEIALLKLAIRDGRLPIYLADGKEPLSVNGNDLAAMVSQRLKSRLQQQAKIVKSVGTDAEIETFRITQYVMAALADEIFILDVDWPGRDAWQHYLLEQSLFRSSNAGRMFFTHLDQLLRSRVQNPLYDDLAAVFLIALQLGFKGQYRGNHGSQVLQTYRAKLIQFLGAGHTTVLERPGFVQAYQYRVCETRDARMAPLSRWYRIGATGLLVYVVISTIVWFVMTNRFGEVLGGGG